MTRINPMEPLYVFGVYMLGSRESAFMKACEVIGEHPNDPEAWLAAYVKRLIPIEKARRFDHFSELDDILRTNTTIPVDLDHPLVQGDAQRLQVLLSELRRTCLLTTLRSLAPERRAVFILLHVLGLSIETCAAILRTTANSVRITDGRARRELDNYLGVRCEHLDPGNPCRCVARLGNALQKGILAWPNHDEHNGVADVPEVHRDSGHLYASLTRVRLPVMP